MGSTISGANSAEPPTCKADTRASSASCASLPAASVPGPDATNAAVCDENSGQGRRIVAAWSPSMHIYSPLTCCPNIESKASGVATPRLPPSAFAPADATLRSSRATSRSTRFAASDASFSSRRRWAKSSSEALLNDISLAPIRTWGAGCGCEEGPPASVSRGESDSIQMQLLKWPLGAVNERALEKN